jgi:hypothetical protein
MFSTTISHQAQIELVLEVLAICHESNSCMDTTLNKIFLGTQTQMIKVKREMILSDVTKLFLF